MEQSNPSLAIDVKGLTKYFQVLRKEEGFFASVKSLVNRKYETVAGVNGIDLQVAKGEIRGLIGPNGAGKSTTIKILSGILHPSSGEVNVLGYTPWLQREEYVRKLGVVFGQKSQLWWDLPAIDTFSLHREMYRIPVARFHERIAYFKELLRIEQVVLKPVRQLSLGERMKCELVCALLHEPRMIFLDEPTIGLDVISKETIRTFIRRLNRETGTTFIVTTHDLEDLENLCDKVTIVNKGTIVFDEPMSELRTYFSNKKIVKATFFEPVGEARLSSFRVTESDELTASIELDLEGVDLQSEIARIFSLLPVKDIDINNIPIEEVIKQIYAA